MSRSVFRRRNACDALTSANGCAQSSRWIAASFKFIAHLEPAASPSFRLGNI
jgi:hypothetical protein